jgi:hypothetical protein
MRNKTLIFMVLLFLSSMTLGKGVSESVPLPEIDYVLNGSVLTSLGVPKNSALVFLDATNTDTSYIITHTAFNFTDDSGKFNFAIKDINSFETGIRFEVLNGSDTIKTPWKFVFRAKNKETLGTYSSHDCNSHTTVAPTNETYIFDSETIVLP